MDENKNRPEERPASPVPSYQPYTPPPRYVIPMGHRELVFIGAVFVCAALLFNSWLYHGMQLGFALGVAGLLLSSFLYLKRSGRHAGSYSMALLLLSLVIIAAFPCSDDGALKFLSVCALLVVPGLAFCLMTGKNRHDASAFFSVFDGLWTLFAYGFGQMSASGRGIRETARNCGKAGKTGGAVALGLLIAVPVVVILVVLLMSADAAFEGLLDLLPEFRWDELLATVLLGAALGYVLYTRTAALHHLPQSNTPVKARKGLHALTVNTVLIAASLVYAVYLVSQLAYFVGGFAGILPEEYTLAEYARRGFFEMGWLCAINLLVIACCIALVSARGKVPGLTRMLCLFLGLVTLFLVATASAKMLLYIGSYGLTRLRVLTEVFMIWLGLTTVFVCVWLFRPKAGYMKQSVLLALTLCAALLWLDVDAQVARYNVRAYQSGKLETVDMTHLGGLSASAVPYIAELTADSDSSVAQRAVGILESKAAWFDEDTDLRGWNWEKNRAWNILKSYRVDDSIPASVSDTDLLLTVSNTVGVDVTDAVVLMASETHSGFHGDGETTAKILLSEAAEANIVMMSVGEAGWRDLAMTENIRKLCDLFTDDNGAAFVPDVQEGLCFFHDRHSQSIAPYDVQSVHSRASYNFTLAIYDAENAILYFMEMDT